MYTLCCCANVFCCLLFFLSSLYLNTCPCPTACIAFAKHLSTAAACKDMYLVRPRGKGRVFVAGAGWLHQFVRAARLLGEFEVEKPTCATAGTRQCGRLYQPQRPPNPVAGAGAGAGGA